MGFLDNSGDIILDAVLTDTGRMRLAKADGSFQISAFALADDEINYGLYNSSHPSGSAYYDLDIKLTPILEAFTNNASFMNSKLISLTRNDHLYLPVIKLNEKQSVNKTYSTSNVFVVTVDLDTATTAALQNKDGVLNGYKPSDGASYVRLDQGIDNSAVNPARGIDPSLAETQYIIKVNDNLGKIYSAKNQQAATPSFIDDDGIAQYSANLNAGADSDYVSVNVITDTQSNTQVIAGARGTILEFKVMADDGLAASDDLFTKLGGTTTIEGVSVRYIDTFVSVEGLTTGYKIDVPVRFIKAI